MNNATKVSCKLCNKSFNIGSKSEIENHMIIDHQLDYYRYYEYSKVSERSYCTNCGAPLVKMTPWSSNLVHLCSKCSDAQSRRSEVIISINEWFEYLTNSHFGRIWILNDQYRDWIVDFDLKNKVDPFIKTFIQKKIDKLNLFDLSFEEGSPKVLSPSNRSSILITESRFNIQKSELALIEGRYYEFTTGKSQFRLYLPEVDQSNLSHYKSYDVMNLSGTSQVKKLRVNQVGVLKLYEFVTGIYSIFRLEKDGVQVMATELSDYELSYVKMFIFSNKHLMRFLKLTLISLVKSSSIAYDRVFFLNRFNYDEASSNPVLLLGWTLPDLVLSPTSNNVSITLL